MAKWVSLDIAAQHASCSRSTLLRWERSNRDFPRISRPSKRMSRICLEELDRWLNRQNRKTTVFTLPERLSNPRPRGPRGRFSKEVAA